MVDLWLAVIGENENNMENQPTPSALQQAEQIVSEFGIDGAILYDHKPVLRIQVPDSVFTDVLNLRTELVEKLKPTGFRFIALDLDGNHTISN